MYCGKCGTDNAPDLSYCVSCGAHLESQRTPSGSTPRPTPASGGTIGGRATAVPPAPAPGSISGQGTRVPVEALEALAVGARIGPEGRYEILGQLGRGGMGIVYDATDHLMREPVALKVMLPSLLDGETARERFRQEASLARRLSHDNVVRVHGADAHGELQLLVMERLEGRTLRAELSELQQQGRKMPVDRLSRILMQACAALDHAHGRGLLHRDVKPENIFLETAAGSEVRVKLLDFGIARAVDPDQWSSTNLAQGTAGYVAPEVLRGRAPTERSDLYSLGVVLYECLTGLLPAGYFEAPSQVRPELRPAWDELVRSLLASSPEKRPEGAQAAAAALRSAFTSAKAPKESSPPPVKHTRPRPPGPGGGPPREQRRPATRQPPTARGAWGWWKWLAAGLLAVGATAWLLSTLADEPPTTAGGGAAPELEAPAERASSSETSVAAGDPGLGGTPGASGRGEPIAVAGPRIQSVSPEDGAELEGGDVLLSGSTAGDQLATARLDGRPCRVWDGRRFECRVTDLSPGWVDFRLSLTGESGGTNVRTYRYRVPDPLTRLLIEAERLEASEELITDGRDALQVFREALDLSPGNERAMAGLRRICARYVVSGQRLLQGGLLVEAREQLEQAERILPGEESVRAALRELEQDEAVQREAAAQASAQRAAEKAAAEARATRERERLAAAAREQEEREKEAKRQAERAQAGLRARVERLGLTFVEVNWAGAEVYRRSADGARMILIRGGRFRMGSADGDPNERPIHEVELSAYLLDETELTWERYVRERPAPPRPSWHAGGEFPVINVSWEDATAYCGAVDATLPTEAQWEYAARGPEGRVYPWGSTWDPSKANGYGSADGHETLAPVGSFPSGRGPFGHLDLAGNAWEWVRDWHGTDTYSLRAGGVRDPTGPANGTVRIMRGGSAGKSDSKDTLRASNRAGNRPTVRYEAFGFRCSMDLP